MHVSDKELIQAILSAGEKLGDLSFVPVLKEGYLLLALPIDRRLAMATVNLYQPQKWKGRLFKAFLKLSVWTGVYLLKSKQSVSIGSGGLMPVLEKKSVGQTLGFILGNPESTSRNLIGVVVSKDISYVVKASFGAGTAVLQSEYTMTKEFSIHTDGIPGCLWGEKFDDGYAYLAEKVEGESPRSEEDIAKVFELLARWLEVGKSSKLSSLVPWKQLRNALLDNPCAIKMVDTLGDLSVVAPVMHGDLTPWNIKLTNMGEVKVLDWEFATRNGVPAWDGIHYQVQQMSLVEGREWNDIYQRCLKWLNGEAMQIYLTKARLLGHESELFAAYCYYSGYVLGYPRSGLIAIWEGASYEPKL